MSILAPYDIKNSTVGCNSTAGKLSVLSHVESLFFHKLVVVSVGETKCPGHIRIDLSPKM